MTVSVECNCSKGPVSAQGIAVKPWNSSRKTPEAAEAVKRVYEEIAKHKDEQRAKFNAEVLDKMSASDKQEIQVKLAKLGMTFDFELCHVKYLPSFKVQPDFDNYEICYVRHGKTEGNTEPRIYQGYCDYWENQLNSTGKKQAEAAAQKMEDDIVGKMNWKPDLILLSPLGRAIETGAAYFKKHPEIPVRVHPGAREQQFGCWDNQQVQHLPVDDYCHLFYLEQNALVKAPAPHVLYDGVVREEYESENFVDLIFREAEFLKSINDEPEVKRINEKRATEPSLPKAHVVIYGHSMAGAAISALLGHGKTFNDKGSIGFDGKYIMPNATPTMLIPKSPSSA